MADSIEYQKQIFGNRLKKKSQHLRKWAKRLNINCFRLYNRDIPEIPLIVDLYDRYLVISTLLRPKEYSDQQYDDWIAEMVDTAERVLGVAQGRTFVKNREKQKGPKQYEKLEDDSSTSINVQEQGLLFECNLSDYLDTGLFLDHRITRTMVGEMSLGKHVLNLFSYTGSFSVYAAAGGAASTTSVDLSNTYTNWAKRNLELNGYFGKTHGTIAMDVFEFLQSKQSKKYDIIILDPPSFSNSKKMNRVLDIQKDHVELIQLCEKHLSKRGLIVFSNNLKSFKLYEDRLDHFLIKDITNKTIDEDFQKKKPHRCYLLQKK